MSREKKFRVYCEFEINGKIHKEMCGAGGWFLLTQAGRLMTHEPMGDFDPNAESKYLKLIPLDYIGLKDKNGKEIYDGDIIVEPHTHNGAEEIGNCEVRYVGSGFCKIWRDKHYGLPNYTNQDANRLEVIGNIYESPELLELPK